MRDAAADPSKLFRWPIPLWVYAAVVGAVFVAAYGGGVGTGFIKDDAQWILRSRIGAPGDLWDLFTHTGGFFRPVVGLSFAVNFWMFGARPLGYGWTNLLLAAAVAVAIFRLALALGLPRGAGLAAAALWILNFHGIDMAVLWLSGRTALFLVLFAVLSATAAARDRHAASCAWALLALFSKEEAVFLPVILLAIAWLRPGHRVAGARLAAFAAGLAAMLAIYFVLRFHSDAMTPATAPSYYRFTLTPFVLTKNVFEYADRALTLSFGAMLLALVVAWRMPRVERHEARLIVLGGVWFAAAFGLTMFLPVRSSLYACFPSIGAAIAAAALLGAIWRAADSSRRRALSLLACILPIMLLPVYWQRIHRWTDLGVLSAGVVHELTDLAPQAPSRWDVILIDDRSTRNNVAAALGSALPDAIELTSGRRPTVWIVPPVPLSPPDEVRMAPAVAGSVLALTGGHLVRTPPGTWKPATGTIFQ